MSELKVTGNINDILNIVSSIAIKYKYPVFIPSLGRNVMFKELSIGQEKAIIKTIIDNPVYNTSFILIIRDIIKENCAEAIDIDGLTLIDKLAISLTMRQKSIGETFDYTFKNTNIKKTISISEYLERINKIQAIGRRVVTHNGVTVSCRYPTIADEYLLESEFKNEVDKNKSQVSVDRDINVEIGDIFINEVVKYIENISIKTETEEIVLGMQEYTFKNRISILEKMGGGILVEILKYITDVNKEINEALTITATLSEEEKLKYNKNVITGNLEAGADFFITF